MKKSIKLTAISAVALLIALLAGVSTPYLANASVINETNNPDSVVEVGTQGEPLTGPAENEISDPDKDAVVRVNALGALCTGVLIKADLVITAEECVPFKPIGRRSNFWITNNPQFAPFLPWQRVTVLFGNRSENTTFSVQAGEYSMAGDEDILVLKLNQNIPEHIAKPVDVMTKPESEPTGRELELQNFFRRMNWFHLWHHFNLDELHRKHFVLSGFGAPQVTRSGFRIETRRKTSASFGQWPENSSGTWNPNSATFYGRGGAALQFGDLGSPVFKKTDSGKRELVGIAHGGNVGLPFEPGRYLITFSTGGRDSSGRIHPNIGQWIENMLNN